MQPEPAAVMACRHSTSNKSPAAYTPSTFVCTPSCTCPTEVNQLLAHCRLGIKLCSNAQVHGDAEVNTSSQATATVHSTRAICPAGQLQAVHA